MGTIGHNSGSLTSAAEANVETGIWLLAKEFLVTAIQDRRLDRGHLRVLACFAQLMNRTSGKAWPGRVTISTMAGMTPKAVSTAVYELKKMGYLISGKEPVVLAGNQTLTVYTFGNIDHDTIRKEITAFVEGLKQLRESSPHRGNSTSPPTGNVPVQGEQKSPQKGNFPTEGEQSSSPHRGTSNSIEDNNKPTTKKTTVERGSRLPADWFLPKAWGEWTVANFEVTPAKVRAEAERFKNYWLSTTTGATKRDWYRTWQNWVSDDRKGWKRRREVVEHAPDLVAGMAVTPNPVHDEWAAARKMTEEPDD
jgi:hypothetical protein